MLNKFLDKLQRIKRQRMPSRWIVLGPAQWSISYQSRRRRCLGALQRQPPNSHWIEPVWHTDWQSDGGRFLPFPCRVIATGKRIAEHETQRKANAQTITKLLSRFFYEQTKSSRPSFKPTAWTTVSIYRGHFSVQTCWYARFIHSSGIRSSSATMRPIFRWKYSNRIRRSSDNSRPFPIWNRTKVDTFRQHPIILRTQYDIWQRYPRFEFSIGYHKPGIIRPH